MERGTIVCLRGDGGSAYLGRGVRLEDLLAVEENLQRHVSRERGAVIRARRAERPGPCGPGSGEILLEAQLAEIFRQAEAGYPEEICGVLIGQRNVPETFRVRQVRNIANLEPQQDPAGLPRDARTAYKMDPLGQLRILREVDQRGWEVVAFYHSHPDHDAYFSAMDRDRALTLDREPLWPGASYLVVSVMAGRARAASCYAWDAARRDFVERPVSPPRRSRVISAGLGPARKALSCRRLLRYRDAPRSIA